MRFGNSGITLVRANGHALKSLDQRGFGGDICKPFRISRETGFPRRRQFRAIVSTSFICESDHTVTRRSL
jgi:hypothetical protein